MSVKKWTESLTGVDPAAHHARHEDGGADELSIEGLSGTSAALTTHAGAVDPHTGYRLESADHSHATTGAQAGQIDHGLAMVAASLLDDDHTQYLLETTLHANTILKADSDHTPIELAVAEQALVGRITGGVITALTGTQVMSILANKIVCYEDDVVCNNNQVVYN